MSDYPKFTFAKYNPDDCKLHGKQFKCPLVDDMMPMDFKRFREVFDKRCGVIVVEEPTRIRPKPIVRFNPIRESAWTRIFRKWLKDNDNEEGI